MENTFFDLAALPYPQGKLESLLFQLELELIQSQWHRSQCCGQKCTHVRCAPVKCLCEGVRAMRLTCLTSSTHPYCFTFYAFQVVELVLQLLARLPLASHHPPVYAQNAEYPMMLRAATRT